MKYLRNGLLFFIVTITVDIFCMDSARIADHFILQDNRIGDQASIFGKFLSAKPVVQYSKLRSGGVDQYVFKVTPQTLKSLPEDFQFNKTEMGFHDLLHEGADDAIFLRFISGLKAAGSRYFVPLGFEDQLSMLLKNHIELLKKTASMPKDLLGEQHTRQYELISSLGSILRFADDLQKIHNKTYCIAGVNFAFSTEEEPEIMKEVFFTLPYIFVSDGMDQGIITAMESFFLESNEFSRDPYLEKIKNVDYYARDLLDTIDTVSRVRRSMQYVAKHPVRNAIIAETDQRMGLIQIARFAHAEQKVLDRLALLLPSFLEMISKAPHNAKILHNVRIHMLVNNDSCCRCDAVIKAAIERDGWLMRTLLAKIEEVKAYTVDTFSLDLHEKFYVSAAVSSFIPYTTSEALEGLDCLRFYSRGGICKCITATNRWIEENDTTKGAILKIYK